MRVTLGDDRSVRQSLSAGARRDAHNRHVGANKHDPGNLGPLYDTTLNLP
jgi:hypothetical protein